MCWTEDEVTIDDAISMTHTRNRAKSNSQIRDRDMELVIAQVRQLRAQGLSFQAISEHIGRAKSYVGWLVDAMGIDRDDDDLAPVLAGA